MGFEPEPVDLIDRADSAGDPAAYRASDGEGVGLPFCREDVGFRLHPPVAVTRA